jgi:hypothetical protein
MTSYAEQDVCQRFGGPGRPAGIESVRQRLVCRRLGAHPRAMLVRAARPRARNAAALSTMAHV